MRLSAPSPVSFRVFIMVILIGCFHSIRAQQKESPKWGDIAPELFELDGSDKFPGSGGLVISDFGTMSFALLPTGLPGAIINRHIRIRILNAEGLYLARQHIAYFAEKPDGGESIRKVRAQTHVLRRGKVETFPVPKSNIKRLDTGEGWKEVQIEFPEASVGSILEYSYRLTAEDYVSPPEWPFQREIPTLLSDFLLRNDKRLDYAIVLMGGQIEQLQLLSDFHWRMEEMPPVREVSYSTAVNDNWHRLRFQLRGERTEFRYIPYLYSWESFSEKLLKDPELGGQLDTIHQELIETARELASLFPENREKIDVLYQTVRDRMSWNGQYGVFASESLDKIWESKAGNGAGINLLLIYLLRSVGIAADPLLIATRDYGKPLRSYPDLNSFNHLICYVDAGTDGRLLDATDPMRPFTIPDVMDLNGVGWLLNRQQPRWAEIKAGRYLAVQQVYGTITLHSDGTLKGKFTETATGYTALNYRKRLKEWGAHTFAQRFLQEYLKEGMVSHYEIKGGDIPENAFVVEWILEGRDYIRKEGDRLFLKPVMMFEMVQNPLREMIRYEPIDFGNPYQSAMVFSYRLPEGYEVVEIPETTRLSFPDREVLMEFRCVQSDDILTVHSSFMLSSPRLPAAAWKPLRSVYQQMIDLHAREIVLEKKAN